MTYNIANCLENKVDLLAVTKIIYMSMIKVILKWHLFTHTPMQMHTYTHATNPRYSNLVFTLEVISKLFLLVHYAILHAVCTCCSLSDVHTKCAYLCTEIEK